MLDTAHQQTSGAWLAWYVPRLLEITGCSGNILVVLVFGVQAFELATGDYLFEPHSGHGYCRDEGKHAGPNKRHVSIRAFSPWGISVYNSRTFEQWTTLNFLYGAVTSQ